VGSSLLIGSDRDIQEYINATEQYWQDQHEKARQEKPCRYQWPHILKRLMDADILFVRYRLNRFKNPISLEDEEFLRLVDAEHKLGLFHKVRSQPKESILPEEEVILEIIQFGKKKKKLNRENLERLYSLQEKYWMTELTNQYRSIPELEAQCSELQHEVMEHKKTLQMLKECAQQKRFNAELDEMRRKQTQH
jgi:hypothetical protein